MSDDNLLLLEKHVCGTPTVCKSVASAASDKVNHT